MWVLHVILYNTLFTHVCHFFFFQPPPLQRTGEKHAWSSKFSSDHQVSVCIPQKALKQSLLKCTFGLKIKTVYVCIFGYLISSSITCSSLSNISLITKVLYLLRIFCFPSYFDMNRVIDDHIKWNPGHFISHLNVAMSFVAWDVEFQGWKGGGFKCH